MKKRYKLTYAEMFDVVVDIDDEKCTDELLHQINNFWSNAKYRLLAAQGDIRKAVLQMLCVTVMQLSITEWNALNHMVEGKEEGWPALDGSSGITLVSVDDYEFTDDEVEICEVAA